MTDIEVKVINLTCRKYLVYRWKDPLTGKDRQKSSGQTRRRLAERQIPEFIEQLLRDANLGETTWEEFRSRYQTEKLASLSRKYGANWNTVAAALEESIGPTLLKEVTSSAVSKFTSHLHGKLDSNVSVLSYLKTLRAAMNWAETIELIESAPRFVMPKIPKSELMRGRAITTEEFERMLESAGVVKGQAKSWRFLLRGLWLSGLRLHDALDLSWDDPQRQHVYRIDGRRPMIFIPAGRDKSKRERLLPMTPDFIEFLRQVPRWDRTGQVFRPRMKTSVCTNSDNASKVISRIGKAAGVVIQKQGDKVKYATAHDLRRSFAVRWKTLGLSIDDLTTLLRHESFETTRNFYLGENAHRTADAVHDAFEAAAGVQKRYTEKSPD